MYTLLGRKQMIQQMTRLLPNLGNKPTMNRSCETWHCYILLVSIILLPSNICYPVSSIRNSEGYNFLIRLVRRRHLLACDIVQSYRCLPMFHRNMLPPSSGLLQSWRWWLHVPPKMSVNIYQTRWCHIPEGSNLHSHCRENLKSHKFN
jgi:hypothetical protein